MDDEGDGGELVGKVGELDFAEAGRGGRVDGGEGGFGDGGKLEGQVSDEDPHERARIHIRVGSERFFEFLLFGDLERER